MTLKIRKRSDRDNNLVISLDNKVWAVLHARTIQTLYRLEDMPPAGLEKELDDRQREELIGFLTQLSHSLLLDHLATAERCESQARNYLRRYHFHASLIETAIETSKARNYLNDARFSSILIETLIQRRKSRIQIVAKLIQLQISPEIWEPILDGLYLPSEQAAIITGEVAKLLLRYGSLPPAKAREKIIRSLFRKGFALDNIIQGLDGCDLRP
ncbi:MAG: RecX family transcriptional regulator [Candidatus Cloacimonetes bacterium]|nr:RecX family transcriptional regulator [Candidatus Cloacimonadota bacterium]